MIDVSVIIPVYNVERYIEKAAASVLGQSHANIEVIFIDDGSTDASGRICDILAAEDPRVRVFHKENQGVGSARNDGMDAAQGEYLYFCDPDDLLDRDLIADNLKLARENQADIVEFGCRIVYHTVDGQEKPAGEILPGLSGAYSYQTFLEYFREECRLGNMLVCRMYRREYLIKSAIRQPRLRVGEDAVFIYQTYRHPFFRIVANPKSYYTYIRREGTATTRYEPDRFDCELEIASSFEETVRSFGFGDGRYNDLIERKYVVGFNLAVSNLAGAELPFKEKLAALRKAIEVPRVRLAFQNIRIPRSFTASTRIKILLLRYGCCRLVLKLGGWKKRIEKKAKG